MTTSETNLTEFRHFRTIEDDGCLLLQAEVDRGWSLISVGVKRNSDDYDGDQFRDEFVCLLGRNDPEP